MMNLRLFSNFLIGYMLLAFCWWALLLWRSNERQFQLEVELLRHNQPGTVVGVRDDYMTLKAKHDRYGWMVIGEGLFFTGCLLAGFIMVRKSVRKEVQLTRQRRNFLLSITHELKSPIASIRLVLETFAKRELTRDQSLQMSAAALRDATRLQNLVQDMLLAARLEDSWRPLLEPLRLSTLVNECTDALKLRFSKANIQNQIPDSLPLLQADKSGMTSVLMNLLENALKYSPENAPVTISAAITPTGKMEIKVADHGKGIPLEERKSVFTKFYRLGNEETRETTGTGLGLYIVQQVIQAHGGTIQIVDKQGGGTVFHIEL